MKIIKREEDETIFFDEILTGDVFTLDDKDFFIKTELHHNDFDTFNAVDLSCGQFHCFDADTVVTPVDCELIIK